MRNKTPVIIIGVVLLVVIGWIVWLSVSAPDKYSWYPSFSHEKEQPYDFSLVKNSLSASYGKNYHLFQNFSTDSLGDDPFQSVFFYLAGNDYLDSIEVESILNFAENGGRVFISSRLQNKLLEDIFEYCLPKDSDIEEPWNFNLIKFKKAKRISPGLNGAPQDENCVVNWKVREDEKRYEWAYFDLSNCDTTDFVVIGEFISIGKVYTNMIEVEYGNGLLVFHTNPLVFTNIHLREREIFQYTNEVLSRYTRKNLYYYHPEMTRKRVGGGGQSIPESPLKFILNNPPLKWGWYLLLALVLLFVINYIRRDQKPIPVQEQPENETANYLDVVSKLYQKEGQHKHIVALKERLLLQFLRNRYGLTSNKLDDDFFSETSIQLEMDEKYVQGFFKDIERAKNNSTLTESDLIKLNSKIKAFYKRCP